MINWQAKAGYLTLNSLLFSGFLHRNGPFCPNVSFASGSPYDIRPFVYNKHGWEQAYAFLHLLPRTQQVVPTGFLEK